MTFFPSAFLGDPLTDEERADLDRREAEARDAATSRLRETLVAAGAPEAAVDAVMPALADTFRIRETTDVGVLEGGMLVHVIPGFTAPADTELRAYRALHLRQPWQVADEPAPVPEA
jgi:hypothetical protein